MQLAGLTILAPAALLALLAVSDSASAAPMDRRVVGSLSCKTVKTGTLRLVNTKTGKSLPATLNNNYRLDDALRGQETPDSVQGIGNPRLLSSYKGITTDGDKYNFQACTESQRPGFEDFPSHSKKTGIYYGHLSPVDAPKHCLTHRAIFADDQALTSELCNYSDDSGSPFSYFTYTPDSKGVIHFLGYTGPKGGNPHKGDQGTYTFSPGSSKDDPSVFVHDGSASFSDYELRLV